MNFPKGQGFGSDLDFYVQNLVQAVHAEPERAIELVDLFAQVMREEGFIK